MPWTTGWTAAETQRPSVAMLGIPPMARAPPALGCAVVARRRARLKTGAMEGFLKLVSCVSHVVAVDGEKGTYSVYMTLV
jgi:hypothetical protein